MRENNLNLLINLEESHDKNSELKRKKKNDPLEKVRMVVMPNQGRILE